MPARRKKRGAYHHGSLKEALVVAAGELIAERGAEGFTLREAARRAGVTHAAAYRHFEDARALVAAVAEDGFRLLRARLEQATAKAPPRLETQLRAQLAAYVRFCWDQRALAAVMFGPRLSVGGEFPALEQAVEDSLGLIVATIEEHGDRRLVGGRKARELGIALWTFAHGFATLSRDKAAYPSAAKTAAAFDRLLTPMLVGMFGSSGRGRVAGARRR